MFCFTFCFIGTILDKCMRPEWFFFSNFMHFVYDFLLWFFLFSISVFFCSIVHDIAVGTKVRILFYVLQSLRLHVLYCLGWLNKRRLFHLSFFNCLCAGTLCIENSHGLCVFHTVCYRSFQAWFILAIRGWIRDLLEQALWHCAMPHCASSTF